MKTNTKKTQDSAVITADISRVTLIPLEYIIHGSWVYDRLYQPGDTVVFASAEDAEYFTSTMPGLFTPVEADHAA